MREDAAYLVSVEGSIQEITPQNGTDFQLKELQELVDGPIEVTHFTNDQIMIVHEEGKFVKRKNEKATRMAHDENCIFYDDYLCGNVVICPEEMFR